MYHINLVADITFTQTNRGYRDEAIRILGSARVVLNGSKPYTRITRMRETDYYRIILVNGELSMSNIELVGGRHNANGGAIYVNGEGGGFGLLNMYVFRMRIEIIFSRYFRPNPPPLQSLVSLL